ncbi:hypothetical protein [Salinicoccus sp. HZC-1]|uniref:hypothetical protein n=1 Tax=Salinicoccus sp. HZC-1 TaxID=3385497 RepID=UPI00398B3F44
MLTGDANYIKTMNRRLVLEDIIRNKSISRISISLSKATVSTQATELGNTFKVPVYTDNKANMAVRTEQASTNISPISTA